MPQPLLSAVMQDKFTTNMSIGYAQDAAGFVADKVFPIIPCENQSGKYPIYDEADWRRDHAQRIALGKPAARAGFDVSNGSYACEHFGIDHVVPWEVMNNAQAPIDPLAAGVQWVTEQLLIKREVLWAASFFVTSVWGTTSTPSTLWDVSTSSPIDDIKTGRTTVQKAIGRKPNMLVLGLDVFEALCNHPDIVERFKYTSADSIDEAMLARLFKVDQCLVASSVYTTSAENNSTQTYSNICGKHALLCFTPKTAGLGIPAGGYTMTWNGANSGGPGNNQGLSIRRYTDEAARAEVISGSLYVDSVLTSTAAGYFFLSAVS